MTDNSIGDLQVSADQLLQAQATQGSNFNNHPASNKLLRDTVNLMQNNPAFATQAQHVLENTTQQQEMQKNADYFTKMAETLGVTKNEPKVQLNNNIHSQMLAQTEGMRSPFTQPITQESREELFLGGGAQRVARNLALQHGIAGEQVESYINNLPIEQIKVLGKRGWKGQDHVNSIYRGADQNSSEQNLANIILMNKRKNNIYAFV